jgi:hypothetical protein
VTVSDITSRKPNGNLPISHKRTSTPASYVKNTHLSLKLDKEELRMINEDLLNPKFPVGIVQCHANYSRKLQWWEIVEFQEFEAMSAEEKRPIIDKICNDEIEKVSAISAKICLKRLLNLLHPKVRQKIGNLSFSLILQLEGLKYFCSQKPTYGRYTDITSVTMFEPFVAPEVLEKCHV